MKMPPVLCCIVFLFVSMLSAVARQQEKPRVIVTTDGEIDDQSSMIRFLMYSSDYDVAGIVQAGEIFHYRIFSHLEQVERWKVFQIGRAHV